MLEQNNYPLPLLIEQVNCPICGNNIREKRSDKDKLWRLQCWENIGPNEPIYVHGDCLKDQSSKLKNIMNNAECAWAI